MSDPFDSLLESMVPGTARHGLASVEAPPFPAGLGLEPIDLIGRGGTGFVFRARDPVLDREVAVKVARPDGGEEARKAVLREARITACLDHPAVLPLHRVAVASGLLCAEYRLAPAVTLATLLGDLRPGRSSDASLLDRLRHLLGAVSAVARAHELDIVHGDLHPGNVAVGPGGEPYVLDWSGLQPEPGTYRGSPGYGAPEQLWGQQWGAPADVFALGAIAWELCTIVQLRPRLPEEGLGEYIARWRDTTPQRLSERVDVPDDVDEIVARALATDPAERPTAAELHTALHAVATGYAERARQQRATEQYTAEAASFLGRYQELVQRIAEEDRVVAVQRAKVPRNAPLADKRALWAALDRAAELRFELTRTWMRGVDAATCAQVHTPSAERSRGILAELWWKRLLWCEEHCDEVGVRVAEERLRAADTGRYTTHLSAPSTVSLEADVPGATARIARFVERDRRLVPEVVEQRELPLERYSLPRGSWLITVSAPGYVDLAYPVAPDRLEHHRGRVRLYRREQIGEGWVLVPGSTFRLGGDRLARHPLDPCTPFIGDLFVQQTCVTSQAWLDFLGSLPPDRAAELVPGEAGLFGGLRFWRRTERGWELPEGWDPQWPVLAVNLTDIEAYSEWLSERLGRRVRLPTEEEWEKAARGVDGRSFPWGDRFDPTFCNMHQSLAGAPRPVPVGSHPVDRSVYGCLDMAANIREITSSVFNEGQYVVRGGNFGDDADDCRVACRSGMQARVIRSSFVGFRLVSDEPAV